MFGLLSLLDTISVRIKGLNIILLLACLLRESLVLPFSVGYYIELSSISDPVTINLLSRGVNPTIKMRSSIILAVPLAAMVVAQSMDSSMDSSMAMSMPTSTSSAYVSRRSLARLEKSH